jgi:hypothetical protein
MIIYIIQFNIIQNEKLVLMDMTPARFEAILSENVADRNNVDDVDLALTVFAQAGGYDKQKVTI